MPVNDLILKEIDAYDAPDRIKDILKEVLKAEEQMDLADGKNYKTNLGKILTRHAGNEDIQEFCNKHGS